MGGFIEKVAGIGEEAGLGIGVEESGGKGRPFVETGLEEVSVELSASGAIPAPGRGAEEGGEGVRWGRERGHSLPPNKQSRVGDDTALNPNRSRPREREERERFISSKTPSSWIPMKIIRGDVENNVKPDGKSVIQSLITVQKKISDIKLSSKNTIRSH